MGTKPRTSVGDALFGRTRQRVLALLFGQPERRFFLNELVRHVNAGKGAVQREIERLVSSGLAELATEGRQRYVRASPTSPVFAEIEALVRKTFGVADVLRVALAPLSDRIEFAGVYGSVARGTAHARSDVDLLVIGDVDYLALAGRLVEPESALGRAINPTLFTRREWQQRLRKGGGFALGLLQEPMMVLMGNFDELGKPREDRQPARAGRRSGRSAAPPAGGPTKPRRRAPRRARS